MFPRLGRFTYRHRRRVAVAWLGLLVAGILIGGQIFTRVTADMEGTGDLESMQVQELLEGIGATNPDILGLVDGVDVGSISIKKDVARATSAVENIDGVAQATDYYSTRSPLLKAKDGRALVIAVYLYENLSDERTDVVAGGVKAELKNLDIGTVSVGGEAFLNEEFQVQSEKDLMRGELTALPVVLVVLLLIFGGIVGAGLPLIVALTSVSGALLFLLGMTEVTDVSIYAINVATMLGLGLAIDYSLLVINRFREERIGGADIAEAVERTVATAGVTVTFSGLTVAAALGGLMFFDDPVMKSLAYGGIGIVVAAMAASITLLPALLGMWGKRIKVKAERSSEHGIFFRLSRFVQRRAVAIVGVVSVGLILLAAPFLGVEFESPGVESLPKSSESRQVFEALESRFGSHGADPITIVTETSPRDPALASFVGEIDQLDGVEFAAVRATQGSVAIVDVLPQGKSQGEVARGLVEKVRGIDTGFSKKVGGSAASLIDYQESLSDRLPYAVVAIAVATFVLLFLMTGSVVIPIKAMIMTVLSLGASFGALIWGFQQGHLAGILDFEATGAIDLWIPIIVFVFAFGLSMDYEVFLLSRIKEEYDRSGDNDHAVAVGLQRTGRIVTSAAILIVTVFLGFAAGELITIKEFGVGMALAVILDATIVRMLLVPATMKLMGDLNWWAPAPLRRIHERFGLHERFRLHESGDIVAAPVVPELAKEVA